MTCTAATGAGIPTQKPCTTLTRLTPYAVLLAAAVVSPWPHAPVPAYAQALNESISEAVSAEMDCLGIAGLTLALVDEGVIVPERGYGPASVELGVAAGAETVYMLASVTKIFTAKALLMLVEEGCFSLDDPIGDLLSDLPTSWRSVTVSQLLHHTSDLPDVQAEDLAIILPTNTFLRTPPLSIMTRVGELLLADE